MPTPDILVWEEWAGSSRGLLSRPILPNNLTALQSNIQSIQAEIYNITDGGEPEVVNLTVADVMLTAPSGKGTWSKDDIGYTFNWPANGDLWPDPSKTYQIVVTFTCNNSIAALTGKSFQRVWRTNTHDPSTL